MTTVYRHPVAVRLRDIDFMNHVNNAVYATYLEQARAGLFRDGLGLELDAIDTVLATLEIQYRRPITAADSVVVHLAVEPLGTSSIPMAYEIHAGDDLAASARTVQVVIDAETGESRPIPAEWREGLAAYTGALGEDDDRSPC